MNNREFLSHVTSGCEASDGVMVLAAFGENAAPEIHHAITDESGMAAAIEFAYKQNELQNNVYWSAGLRRSDLDPGARGSETDITQMMAIVVDLDEADAALVWQEKLAPLMLMPTYAIRTSTTPTARYQLVYLLNEPTDDFEKWKEVARKLEDFLGGDHCSKDISHVWRIPNTTNWPNQKKRDAGRLPEMSEITYEGGQCYELDDFDILPEPVNKPKAEAEIVPLDIKGTSQDWNDTIEIMSELPDWLISEVYYDRPGRDRSEFDFQLAKEVARCPALNDNDYLALYHLSVEEAFTSKWKEKERGKPGVGDAYLAATMAKALAEVAEEPMDMVEAPTEGQYKWRRASEIENDPDPKWLLKNLLPEASFAMIYGPSGDGKSFTVINLAIALANGTPFLGHEVCRAVPVAFVAAEGGGGLKNRLKAHNKIYGFDANMPLYVLTENPDLSNPQQAVELIASMKQLPVFGLIIIDTMNLVFGGGDENSSEAMASFIRSCKSIIKATGATVLLVHHTGKDESRGSRGHSSMKAALDTELALSLNGQRRTLKATKQKDGETGVIGRFKLEQVYLGYDADGDPVTSCVIESLDASQAAEASMTKTDFCKREFKKNRDLTIDFVAKKVGCDRSVASRARKELFDMLQVQH